MDHVPTVADYSYRLDAHELARYRAMAAAAVEHEADLWTRAGIAPDATVIDLGCGPGTFLPALAERTGPGGTVIGVDQSPEAIQAAEALVRTLALGSVTLLVAPASATGLATGAADTVFIRNVLVHNGPRLADLLSHVRDLLRDGGHLLCAEPDLDALRIDDAPSDQQLERRWVKWARSVGNEPALGPKLEEVVAEAGFEVVAARSRVDTLRTDRTPVWTAVDNLIAGGFATAEEAEQWEGETAHRLATTGPFTAHLPVYTVVAQSQH